jgi:hypothetical protein
VGAYPGATKVFLVFLVGICAFVCLVHFPTDFVQIHNLVSVYTALPSLACPFLVLSMSGAAVLMFSL